MVPWTIIIFLYLHLFLWDWKLLQTRVGDLFVSIDQSLGLCDVRGLSFKGVGSNSTELQPFLIELSLTYPTDLKFPSLTIPCPRKSRTIWPCQSLSQTDHFPNCLFSINLTSVHNWNTLFIWTFYYIAKENFFQQWLLSLLGQSYSCNLPTYILDTCNELCAHKGLLGYINTYVYVHVFLLSVQLIEYVHIIPISEGTVGKYVH